MLNYHVATLHNAPSIYIFNVKAAQSKTINTCL